MLDTTLAILNANIITLNPKQPKAQAIAIHEGKIIAVGSNKEINKHVDDKTRTINAKGKTVVPGLTDCHVHMTGFGRSLQNVDLRNAKSIKEIQRQLKQHAKKNPGRQWITGGCWDQAATLRKTLPNPMGRRCRCSRQTRFHHPRLWPRRSRKHKSPWAGWNN